MILSQFKPTFQYRFEENQISGHSLGNLLIAGMTNITNDFGHAIKALSKILNIKGRVIPSTNTSVQLNAVMEDGEIVLEKQIFLKNIKKLIVCFRTQRCATNGRSNRCFKEADLIVLGPGSLYTSVISNLCVNGISDALIHSDAPKLYVSNVMTQPGETDGYSVKDHIDAIHRQAGQPFIDYVICSTTNFQCSSFEKI